MNPRAKKRVEPRVEAPKETQVEPRVDVVESSSFLLRIIVMSEQ